MIKVILTSLNGHSLREITIGARELGFTEEMLREMLPEQVIPLRHGTDTVWACGVTVVHLDGEPEAWGRDIVTEQY